MGWGCWISEATGRKRLIPVQSRIINNYGRCLVSIHPGEAFVFGRVSPRAVALTCEVAYLSPTFLHPRQHRIILRVRLFPVVATRCFCYCLTVALRDCLVSKTGQKINFLILLKKWCF
ncbi:hypothetical protein CEXT_56331 [Caerostris extrusa]|uniref:Uncharacterized protein n=1 Tax=Caerostris extrusa TaxID=172846 RepID=A0AAV4T0U8_CAEEX|nr:hypothetical protein CEXT_56331 [Caerostris extrusa]